MCIARGTRANTNPDGVPCGFVVPEARGHIVRHDFPYIILFLARQNELRSKDDIHIYRICVSLALFAFCWWRHNRLCNASWNPVIVTRAHEKWSNSSDIEFIHCDPHQRSSEKYLQRQVNSEYGLVAPPDFVGADSMAQLLLIISLTDNNPGAVPEELRDIVSVGGLVPNITRKPSHYSDVIMSAMASQITDVSIVCSTVCSDADQRKHQSSTSLSFVRGIHRWPVNSPYKRPVTRKTLSFDDVIMATELLVQPLYRNTSCLYHNI